MLARDTGAVTRTWLEPCYLEPVLSIAGAGVHQDQQSRPPCAHSGQNRAHPEKRPGKTGIHIVLTAGLRVTVAQVEESG